MGFCCCCCFCTFSAKLPFRFHFESIWISFWNIDQKLWFTLRFIFIIMAKQWAVKLSFVPFYFYAVFWILAFSRNISFNKTFIGYILHCCVDKEIIYIPKLRCSIDIECECDENDQCIRLMKISRNWWHVIIWNDGNCMKNQTNLQYPLYFAVKLCISEQTWFWWEQKNAPKR